MDLSYTTMTNFSRIWKSLSLIVGGYWLSFAKTSDASAYTSHVSHADSLWCRWQVQKIPVNTLLFQMSFDCSAHVVRFSDELSLCHTGPPSKQDDASVPAPQHPHQFILSEASHWDSRHIHSIDDLVAWSWLVSIQRLGPLSHIKNNIEIILN